MSTSSERGRWLVMVMALLTGVGFAWASWGKLLGMNCLWVSGADGAQVERFLQSWLAESHGPALVNWDVRLEPRTAQIELATAAGDYRIDLLLGSECWTSPDVQLLRPERSVGFPTAKDLHALAAGFPAPKKGPSLSHSIIVALFIIAACLGLGVALSSPPLDAAWLPAARHIAWVLLLVVLAAWPILFVPFDTDAPALRAAFAAVDVFADWNHPFLPYLLNRPTTWFSLEPWALRLVPFAFLCAETALMMLAANRDGGNLAGALAGIWFACEVRRRHGLFDLGDWDVGGTFLMALLLMVQRRKRIGWGSALVICTLMAAGVMSSWLMIVVSGVLVGCLGIEAMRGKLAAGPPIGVGIVFALLAAFSLTVFAAGSRQPALVTVGELWRQMYDETPVGRSLAMALPVALGVAWLATSCDRLAPRFVALCLIAVPSAVYLAYWRSHVNGGYYVGLVTPMLLYAASVATARAIETLADAAARMRVLGALPYFAITVRGILALAVAVATVSHLGTGEMAVGAEQLKMLAHDSRADSLPIFTNSPDLVPLLAFERARAGEGPIAAVIGPGPADLRPRIHLLDRGSCAPAPDAAEAGFYLVYLDSEDRDARRTCVERLGSRCRDLLPPTTGSQRTNWVLRCDGAARR